ncbi:MAG TPA: hypothetical protein VKJ47_00285 [Candidatus Binatia bacterium]|nr:hypothetical protein [Candidatus Binatia bacterium]
MARTLAETVLRPAPFLAPFNVGFVKGFFHGVPQPGRVEAILRNSLNVNHHFPVIRSLRKVRDSGKGFEYLIASSRET